MKDSKSPSRVREGDEGVAGRKGREKNFPDEGSLICPLGIRQINVYEQKGNRNKVS